MIELGPFRINRDNKTLSRNENAWNRGDIIVNLAVFLFLIGSSRTFDIYGV